MNLSIRRLVRLSYLIATIREVAAVFDPDQPGVEENFYPGEADPKGKITCQGPPPSFRIPRTFGLQSDPNTWTLQELCAKPQYGGRGIHQHGGAYCYHYDTPNEAPRVVFDSSPIAQASPVLQNARMLAYCLLRCFCTYGITREDAYHQIKPVRDMEFGNRILTPDEDSLGGMELGDRFWDVVTYELPGASQLEAQQWQANHNMEPYNMISYVGVSINPANTIECDGNVPPMALTLDDITPNIGMTWQNWAQSHTLRAHCFSMCHCGPDDEDSDEDLDDKITIPGVFEFVRDRAIGIGGKGNVDIFVKNPNGATLKYSLMQPADGGSKVAVGACEDDAKRFCPVEDWPEDILGPLKPTAPVPPPPDEDLVQLSQCGTECNDQSDCGSFEKGCRCIAPKSLPQYVPLDPIFPKLPELPKGRCLSLTPDLMHAIALDQVALRKRESEVSRNESLGRD
ncbi:uncharacterized protein KY384_005111 [Bacidia gigantensis]|uniref:uncharacterized protein n=1 Tax=Bacidia gigantensis TaxID=2732470 RepID=UPI001D048526|nr:uncharacterized protein KY384_005111 [Bacidia gigantensis]KAG8529631.1 hypothetical protein KY384_005111 [Bacidia gigantensis]